MDAVIWRRDNPETQYLVRRPAGVLEVGGGTVGEGLSDSP
jgi:hypothetical protein